MFTRIFKPGIWLPIEAILENHCKLTWIFNMIFVIKAPGWIIKYIHHWQTVALTTHHRSNYDLKPSCKPIWTMIHTLKVKGSLVPSISWFHLNWTLPRVHNIPMNQVNLATLDILSHNIIGRDGCWNGTGTLCTKKNSAITNIFVEWKWLNSYSNLTEVC